MEFKKIATGVNHVTKTGRKCIKMSVDKEAMLNIPDHFLESVFVFKDEKEGQTEYVMMAQVDENLGGIKQLKDMDNGELNFFFQKWLQSKEGVDTLQQIGKIAIDEHERESKSVSEE